MECEQFFETMWSYVMEKSFKHFGYIWLALSSKEKKSTKENNFLLFDFIIKKYK